LVKEIHSFLFLFQSLYPKEIYKSLLFFVQLARFFSLCEKKSFIFNH